MEINILFLDDDENRIGFVRQLESDFNLICGNRLSITYCKSLRDFKNVVHNHIYDIVCFDHDLEPGHYVNWRKGTNEVSMGTGADCARHFVKSVNYAPEVYIHSWNIPGSENIEAILAESQMSGTRIMFGKAFLDRLWVRLKDMASVA